jgi:hypothetical protein
LKIAVYTIALNEQKFADRWAATTSDADYALVADTGSTDATVERLCRHDIAVVPIAIRPWRFDDARNAALALLPSDIDVAISLDMDETLAAGWRDKLEATWTPTTTRLKYGYVWNFKHGKPDLTFLSDKISGRFTHRWKTPVHEVLTPTIPEVVSICQPVLIEHHADPSKSRGQYLPLLELAAREDPHDDRSSHYLAREYFFHARYHEAIAEFERHLALPRALWLPERAASMRYIASCYEHLQDFAQARSWYTRATLEDPQSREALIDAAKFYLKQNAFHQTIAYCLFADLLPASSGEYMADRYAREEGAADLMAVAYWHLGQRQEAIRCAEHALVLNPQDTRLKQNLDMMRK